MSTELNFTDNKDWLLPFLEDFKKQNDIDGIEEFAIKNVEKMFNIKTNKVFSIFSMFSKPEPIDSFDKKKWKDCAQSLKDEIEIKGCRNSTGFDGKIVPNNVEFNEKADKNNLDKAERSYKYLKYSHDIETILIRTPSSDYTRRDDVLRKYRLIDYLKKKEVSPYNGYNDWIAILIAAYNTNKTDTITIINKFTGVNDDTKYDVLKIYADDEFNGDSSNDINQDLQTGVNNLTEVEETHEPDKKPKHLNNENSVSFFNPDGSLKNGGKSKKKTRKSKKRKSKTSKKTSKKRTIKRKSR
tara:strand:- start:487 stop:1380 length:894 start_codon:yes stop_codon:yes gene_type:complete